MEKRMIVRVTATEFELDDGRIFTHSVELDEVPTPEEFQEIYDQWFMVFQDMLEDSKVGPTEQHQ